MMCKSVSPPVPTSHPCLSPPLATPLFQFVVLSSLLCARCSLLICALLPGVVQIKPGPGRPSAGAALQRRWRSGGIKAVPDLGVPTAVSAAARRDQSVVETLMLRTALLSRCSPAPPVLYR